MAYAKEINVIGKACPLPLISLARETQHLAKGQRILITGNDPIFEESVVAFCQERFHEVLETTREGRARILEQAIAYVEEAIRLYRELGLQA